MRLATVVHEGREQAAVVTDRGLALVADINAQLGRAWSTDLFTLLQGGLSPLLEADARAAGRFHDPASFRYGPLYRHPRKIWGIGLNYRDHAADLNAVYPDEPASFIKGDQTIIGPGDPIVLPPESQRVTAEAEIGVIIGKTCRRVSEADALNWVAGYCLILDMTAEDILQRNPRFLTRSKNFDTFFAFGPHLITRDEVPDVLSVQVGTWKNGGLHRENVVANMQFPPAYLVSFHSHVMTLYPGDIISTGTPGAVVIEDGDVAECRIAGLGSLTCPVSRPSM
ncbi:MAG: fumarylacetoacetate hydrolase family protein [Burkholderiales bacterium]|nr:fumarylacetoacetate hydrolase family protein [Burkholderiales bacterium]